jgi:hypothetical protein
MCLQTNRQGYSQASTPSQVVPQPTQSARIHTHEKSATQHGPHPMNRRDRRAVSAGCTGTHKHASNTPQHPPKLASKGPLLSPSLLMLPQQLTTTPEVSANLCVQHSHSYTNKRTATISKRCALSRHHGSVTDTPIARKRSPGTHTHNTYSQNILRTQATQANTLLVIL